MMFPFSQSVTPAIRSHLDAQTSFMNDMSKSIFQSFQQLCNLNIQLTQTMLEEATQTSQQMLTADRPANMIGAAASRAQPATDKLRAYQQHLSRVAADSQVELARVTEEHVQETTRTARALADEVQRAASEETERNMRTQQETMRKFTDPFMQSGAQKGGNGSASMQSGQNGSSMGGSGQGSSAQGASSGGSQSDLTGTMQGGGSTHGALAGTGSSGSTGSASGKGGPTTGPSKS